MIAEGNSPFWKGMLFSAKTPKFLLLVILLKLSTGR